MKITKRIISVILALLLAFGSVSLLATAAASDTVDITFKYYREENGEWIPTTKIARGDTVKARMFISTNFPQTGMTVFFTYPDAFMKHEVGHLTVDPTDSSARVLALNSGNPQVTDNSLVWNVVDRHPNIKDTMTDDGGGLWDPYLPESYFEQYAWFNAQSDPTASAFQYTDTDWVGEFTFTVSETAEGNGYVYIPAESIVNQYEGIAAYTDIQDADGYCGMDKDYTWNVLQAADMTEDDMLSLTQKVKFAAGANGTISGTTSYEGYIGETLSAIDGFAAPTVTPAAGYKFIGWSYGETVYENAASFVVDYDEVTLTAVYETTAEPTADYTVNVYTMDTNGDYGEAKVETYTGNIGETVTYSPVIPEGFYLDENQDNILTTEIKADGSAAMNVYVGRNVATVKFTKENGTTIVAAFPAYYGSTYTLIDAIEKEGYVWTGWEAGKVVEAKPATDGEEIKYVASYEAGENKVVINTYYDDAMLGGTVDLAPYTVATKTGYTVKVVNEIPAVAEENVTYVLKSALPTAEHYEIDADAEYTVAVADDGSAVLEIAYVSKTYTVTFLDANGEVLYTGNHNYYDAVDAPGASDLGEQGKLFEAWEIVEGEGEDLYDEFATIDVVGNVTYKARYENLEFYAFYASEEVDGYDAPSLEDLGLAEEEGPFIFGDEIVLPDLTGKVEGYEFLGYEVLGADYDEETNTVTVLTEDIDIIALWDINEYTVTWIVDGEEDVESVVYGEAIVAPAAPTKEGNTFAGWGAEIPATMPAEDLTFTAQWNVNNYTVTWIVDGKETEVTYAYGATIVAPAAPTKEGNTFAGWGAEVPATMPAKNLEFTAQWTVNNYTVTWDVDGVKTTETYAYGATINKKAAPAKEGNTFTGWAGFTAGMTMPANNDLVFTATWDVNSYTATFDAADGKFADGADTKTFENITYGSEFAFDDVPVLDGYTFAGWSEDGTTIVDTLVMDAEGKTYTAIFTENGKVNYTVEIYLMGTDGKYADAPSKTDVTKTQTVGLVATATHADYPQDAWFSADETAANVTSATMTEDGATLKLYYARAKYAVSTDVDGTVTKVADYYYDEMVAAPAAPADKEGYAFAGWIGYTEGMTMPAEDVTFTADWAAKNFTVTWDVDGVKTTETVAYGEAIVAPTAPTKEGNTFAGWGAEIPATMPAKNLEFTAQWNVNNYTVTWIVDGKETEATYAYGATIVAPTAPTKEGYDFTGWGAEIPATMPAENLTFTAEWKVQSYVVTWVVDGEIIAKETYKYGEEIKEKTVSENVGYTFSGWEGFEAGMTMPAEDLTFTAQWNVNSYTVTWIVDGKETEVTYAYGATIVAPAAPTKEGNTFAGWGAEVPATMPAKNLEFTAQWTVNNYTVTWVVDGVETTETYAYGATINEKAAPAKEGNTFTGWEGFTAGMTMPAANQTFTAQWTVDKYDVVFMINDTVYASAKAAFGTEIVSVGTPADEYIPEGYTFKGWSTDKSTVITDFGTVAVGGNTFYAVLEINSYTITFVVDEEVVKTETLEYGATIVAPTAPNKEADGLKFAGWVDADDETKMPTKMPAKDATYVATYVDSGAQANYTVEVYHMDTNGKYELTATTVLTAHVGETVAVSAGTVKGFTFNEAESVINAKVEADGTTTLKVCYDRNLYTVKFDDAEPIEVFYGAAIPVVKLEDQADKAFAGWTPEVPAAMPAENLEFTSVWEEVKYTVTYYVNGETTETEYAYGATIEIPADPSVEGMEFTGWTDIPADGKMPAKDIIIIANFKAAVYTVTFKNADGSVFDKKAVKFGEEIILPATEPTLEYHTFAGWSGVPADGKMPAEDIEITALFDKIDVMLVPKNDTCTTVIDRNGQTTADYEAGVSTWYIYGLEEVLMDEVLLAEYIDVQGDGRIEIVYNEYDNGRSYAPWVGTGTVINVYDNNDESGEPVESFTIVIFGDLNGDSYVNATDWAIAEDEVAYYTMWSDDMSDEYCAYMVKAADFDENGVITEAESANICNVSLRLYEIDQVEGKVIEL